MALKRRRAEAAKDAAVCHEPRIAMHLLWRIYVLMALLLQNEYAAILAKRVNEEKAKKTELRSK